MVKFLELPNGIPSHDTMQRVISLLNPETLYSSCIKFLIEKIDNLTIKDKTKDGARIDIRTRKFERSGIIIYQEKGGRRSLIILLLQVF